MNFQWNYGDRVLNLPAAALEAGATDPQLRILLLIADGLSDERALAKAAGMTEEAIRDGIAFWRESGVLRVSDAEKEVAPTPKKNVKANKADDAKKLAHADEIPNYSLSELTAMMERRRSLRTMLDESQRILGKMFNTYEINLLFGMVDYLNLDEDYILLLLAHCRRIGKTGLRSIERYAISLIDRGITTAPGLEEQVQDIEAQYTLEGNVRAIFGMKNRSLTAKEQKMILSWSGFGYGEDVIRRAYEITVDTINEPSMKYANAILERWHAEHLTTLAEIDRRIEEEKTARGNATPREGSFDTDAFFEAALKRSFGKTSEGQGKDQT